MDASLGDWVLAGSCQYGSAGNFSLGGFCRQVDDLKDLLERLSETAHVYLPDSDNFAEATMRWSVLDSPGISLVVVPAIENDVVETVKYANEKNTPFLAVNGGHGAITTVGRLHDGIEIWMNQLSGVEVVQDGTAAIVAGGTLSKTIIDTLWAAGKQTVTGACECTSLLGVGLGGGHGFLQGRYGLIADQFISMNVVFANGTMGTVNATSEPDLWWAMQGAGHNFGIVTSVAVKIYDIENYEWAFQSFIFTGDNVEGLYEAINLNLLKNGTQPVDIINYSFFFNYPGIDPTKPVIMFYILQEGVTVVDSTYTKPFEDLGPVVMNTGSGVYTDLAAWTGNDNKSPPCQKAGLVNIRFAIDLKTYNVSSQRQVYDLFASATQETPALNNSLFLFEGYSLQGVQAIPRESTAFPFRGNNLLVSPLLVYSPDGDELDMKAKDLGHSLRQILCEGSGQTELHTYVNYAFGDETTQNWYGYEEWRQKRLLALKQKHDPQGKFSFYAPIA